MWAVKLCAPCDRLSPATANICSRCLRPLSHSFAVQRATATENREGLVSHAHGATARQAAKRVAPRTGTQRWGVLCALVTGPATRDELQRLVGIGANALRPRVKELLDDGYIEVSGSVTKANGQTYELLSLTDLGKMITAPGMFDQ